MEPFVCTLLRLWMLPLLRRAYINLACSKAALWRSALPLRVALGVVAAVKRPACIHPSPRPGLHPAGSEVRRMQMQAVGPIHQQGALRQREVSGNPSLPLAPGRTKVLAKLIAKLTSGLILTCIGDGRGRRRPSL